MLIATSFTTLEHYNIYMNNNLYGTKLTSFSSQILAYLYIGSRGIHLLQILVYNYLAISYILKARSQMNNSFSGLDTYQIRYFYIANISFILLMSIPGFYVTLIGRAPLQANEMLLFFVCFLFTSLYLILAYIGLKQQPINLNLTDNENKRSFDLHPSELTQVKTNLIAYFNKNKPWLNPNLNIWEVASEIGTNRSYVSKVINEHLGINFNHFVNNYRIKEAKSLLKANPELSVAEISEMSGFGSINSFLRIFKEFENCTPTEFKNN